MSSFMKFFSRKQPRPKEISFNLSKNKLINEYSKPQIFKYNDNINVSYNYTTDSGIERLTIYSIIIRTNDTMYTYKGDRTPEDILFYTDNVPDKIHIYLNIENLDTNSLLNLHDQLFQQQHCTIFHRTLTPET